MNPDSLAFQIQQKNNYNKPYYASNKTIYQFATDLDHFPYERNFRGIYNFDYPVINERQVGWRPRNDSCYRQISFPVIKKAEFCWQYPCSTIFPCIEARHEPAAPPPPKNVSCGKKAIILPP